MRYVAFLRGVNVGGHKPLRMADLRAAFEGMGFEGVRTVQASGNVVFEAGGEESAGAVAERIEIGLEKVLGYPIGLAVRALTDIERLVASDPFGRVAVTPETRLYVTFLSHPAKNGTGIRPDKGSDRGPDAAGANARLVDVTAGEILTAITLSPRWGSTELMAWVEKEFGTDVTTRNWNTIVKIAGG
jgi:uncharacterized protein (DUF1697 family)